MAFMTRIEPKPASGELVIVRLLRRYAACRASDEQPLPSLIGLGGKLGLSPPAVIALASVFQITEACLNRALVTERCCDRRFSPDERAVLMLIASRGVGPVQSTRLIPHGLPGVLVWAIASARRLCEEKGLDARSTSEAVPTDRCPFRG